MTTCSEIIQLALTKMGRTAYIGTTATGGSASTFVDTKLGTSYTSSDLTNGTCIVTRDAAGSAAAPEGEFARITAYDASTWTGTITTLAAGSLTAAIANNDTLMLILPKLPLIELIRCLNETLQSFGKIPTWNSWVKTKYPGARGSYHATMSLFGDTVSDYLAKDLVATKLARQLFFYSGITDRNREEFNKVTMDLQMQEAINPVWPNRPPLAGERKVAK